MRGVRIFEPNQNIFATCLFQNSEYNLCIYQCSFVASKTFPVSVVPWQLSAGSELQVLHCPWKDITDTVPFIFHSLWLPPCLKKIDSQGFLWSRAALYVFTSLPGFSKLYSCSGQFGAYYSYHCSQRCDHSQHQTSVLQLCLFSSIFRH